MKTLNSNEKLDNNPSIDLFKFVDHKGPKLLNIIFNTWLFHAHPKEKRQKYRREKGTAGYAGYSSGSYFGGGLGGWAWGGGGAGGRGGGAF